MESGKKASSIEIEISDLAALPVRDGTTCRMLADARRYSSPSLSAMAIRRICSSFSVETGRCCGWVRRDVRIRLMLLSALALLSTFPWHCD